MPNRRSFGTIRQQRSGRYQAEYTGPDARRHRADVTFSARADAEGWLNAERRLIEWGTWTAPSARKVANDLAATRTLRLYSAEWLPSRTASKGLKPKTVSEYQRYLDRLILPTLGDILLQDITPQMISAWVAKQGNGTPRITELAYSLLKSILATAVEEELISKSPCRTKIRKSAHTENEPPSIAELHLITDALPERLRLMVELAAFCALRFGEVAALQRRDVDLEHRTIRIQRAVQWVDGVMVFGRPKADSQRVVHYPPHLHGAVVNHLTNFAQWGKEGLLFPTTNGGPYRGPTFYGSHWRKARAAADREDLRFHDLRHFGATAAARDGATLRELQNRLGHRTVAAAMRYQHAASDSDRAIAERLSASYLSAMER